MATLEKKSSRTNHNYTIEDFDEYAIIKRRKENSEAELRVIQFDESIIEKLARLKELDREKHSRVVEVLIRLKRMLKE